MKRISRIYHNFDSYWGKSRVIIVKNGIGIVKISESRLEPGIIVISQLSVQENKRGQGLGNCLLEIAEEEAIKMGAYKIKIHAALGDFTGEWYKRHGYTPKREIGYLKCEELEKMVK